MKSLTIQLTDEEYDRLKEKALNLSDDFEAIGIKITPRRIIEQFVSDLTASERSGGSDEHDFAYDWYNLSKYNF